MEKPAVSTDRPGGMDTRPLFIRGYRKIPPCNAKKVTHLEPTALLAYPLVRADLQRSGDAMTGASRRTIAIRICYLFLRTPSA
jgi:hypothetical protein